MFTIHTARPGEAYHTLTPCERLVHKHSNLGLSKELRVAVRVDYGDPHGPYLFKAWLDCAYGVQDPVELITLDELHRRRQQAKDNGDTYDDSNVHPVHNTDPLWGMAQGVVDHFRACMALKLFVLPACA